jgi:hypothetical protein
VEFSRKMTLEVSWTDCTINPSLNLFTFLSFRFSLHPHQRSTLRSSRGRKEPFDKMRNKPKRYSYGRSRKLQFLLKNPRNNLFTHYERFSHISTIFISYFSLCKQVNFACKRCGCLKIPNSLQCDLNSILWSFFSFFSEEPSEKLINVSNKLPDNHFLWPILLFLLSFFPSSFSRTTEKRQNWFNKFDISFQYLERGGFLVLKLWLPTFTSL